MAGAEFYIGPEESIPLRCRDIYHAKHYSVVGGGENDQWKKKLKWRFRGKNEKGERKTMENNIKKRGKAPKNASFWLINYKV